MSEKFVQENLSKPKEESTPEVFSGLIATIEADPMRVRDAYVLKFPSDEAMTTIRVVLNDYSGADLVITNMTTLPHEQTGSGLGSKAIQELLKWATSKNMEDIRAVQVQRQSENFWIKNSFERLPEPNPTSDFAYRNSSS